MIAFDAAVLTIFRHMDPGLVCVKTEATHLLYTDTRRSFMTN